MTGMSPLTVFTPTYNRAHTLPRVYDSLCRQSCRDFCWLVVDDGSTDSTSDLVNGWIAEGKLPISYIYKENGGLHTAYNAAYAAIDTELCVCIDSDDFMPPRAVEIILREWRARGSDKFAGLLGLDFDELTGPPIGGKFPEGLRECFFLDLYTKKIHIGDSKPVMRTALMKEVAPQVGFPGEKNFNPVYMMLQVCDELPLLVVNENLCFVDYQTGADSMSEAIFSQYMDSPRSFSKLRRLEMTLKRSTWRNRVRVAVHYVATSLIAGDKGFITASPLPVLTAAVVPFGWLLSKYIRHKARK